MEAAQGAHGMAVVLIEGQLHEGSHGRTRVPIHVVLQQGATPRAGPLQTLVQVVRVVTDLLQQSQHSGGR